MSETVEKQGGEEKCMQNFGGETERKARRRWKNSIKIRRDGVDFIIVAGYKEKCLPAMSEST